MADAELDDVLVVIKQLVVVDREFRFSEHVYEYIACGEFTPEDPVFCIASARQIEKREKDRVGDSYDGWTYTIIGRDSYGGRFYTCGKIKVRSGMRFYFFITAHE